MTPKKETASSGYYSSFTQILAMRSLIPGLSAEQSEGRLHLHLEHDAGVGDLHVIPVFSGMSLLGMDYHLPVFRCDAFLPNAAMAAGSRKLISETRNRFQTCEDIAKFNYCHLGRAELLTGNDVYVHMKERELCIDRALVSSDCEFPQGYYLGFALIIERDFSVLNPEISEAFGIDIDQLCGKYLNPTNQFTYITRCGSETLALCEEIFHISCHYEKKDIFRLRALIFQLISAYQSAAETIPAGTRTYLTNSQIGIAKDVAKRLRADLSAHIPAKKMAAEYGTSETSLKNYFREVYGENLSDYRNRLRMQKAAELLCGTSLSVSAVAEQVGYASQSKFAAAFKKYYEASPMEYRRKSALRSIIGQTGCCRTAAPAPSGADTPNS